MRIRSFAIRTSLPCGRCRGQWMRHPKALLRTASPLPVPGAQLRGRRPVAGSVSDLEHRDPDRLGVGAVRHCSPDHPACRRRCVHDTRVAGTVRCPDVAAAPAQHRSRGLCLPTHRIDDGVVLPATLYAAARAIDDESRSSLWTLVAVAACAAGMACKESMVTAPVMVLLYDVVFGAGSIRQAVPPPLALYASLAATWLVLIVLNLDAPRSGSAGFSTATSTSTYLLNQAVMIGTYLKLSIWPTRSSSTMAAPSPCPLRTPCHPCCWCWPCWRRLPWPGATTASCVPWHVVLRHARALVQRNSHCHRGRRRAAHAPAPAGDRCPGCARTQDRGQADKGCGGRTLSRCRWRWPP